MIKSGARPAALIWQELIRPALLYSGLALLLTYPLVGQFAAAAAGFAGRDPFQHVWYQWWMKETLLEWAIWPDRVGHLFYPLGADHPVLALHPYVPLVSLPFTLLFGPLVSYNLAFWLSFVLSGLSGYLLCRYLCRHSWAALLGGLIFAFYPNRLGHAAAGHLLLTTNYFLPLYALSLLVLLARPSPRRAAWHGVVTGLLALAQPTHIGYGIAPVFLFLAGGYLWRQMKAGWAGISRLRPSLGWLVAANLLALVLFLPFAWPTLRQTGQGELGYLTPGNLTDHAADLLAFVMPSPYNPLLAALGWVPSFSGSIVESFRDLEEQLAYPGLVAVVLAGAAAWKRRRASFRWLALALVCAVFSLGPFLKIGGEVLPVALPYAWLTDLPFFEWSRTPGRLNGTVMLGVAVLAALGLDWLLGRTGRRRWSRFALAAGLSGVILVEYLVIFPFPVESRPVSDYYRSLAGQDLQGGVLELPVAGSRRASNYAMYYQTVHGHPLAGGYIERDPAGTVELKEFLNQLVSPLPAQEVIRLPGEIERQQILKDMSIEQVIAHPELMTDRAAKETLGYLPHLLGPTLFEDNELLVYPVDPGVRPADPAWRLLPDQEGWEVVREGQAFRLRKQGTLFFYGNGPGQVNLRLDFDAPSSLTLLTVTLNDRPLARHAAGPEAGSVTVPLSLRPGFNYSRLSTDPPQDLDFLRITME